MSDDQVEAIARAVLYEGYLLYPYRPSAVKNRMRWTIGGVHPPASAEPSEIGTECLLEGAGAGVQAELRYLQPGAGAEAVERRRPCPPGRHGFVEAGIAGETELALEPLGPGLQRVSVRVANHTRLDAGAGREMWLPFTMASAHLALRARGGRFVSMTDPPGELAGAAAACRQQGLWPVLVGSAEDRACMLAAPIILEDFPRIAPESHGDLFDGTEIDEILTLRILTLTEAEKAEIRRTDERARRLLERTEGLTPDQLLQLHGRVRGG